MGEKAFDQKIKDIMSQNVPAELTGGKWHGVAYPHIYCDKKYNFIDEKYPVRCDIKGNYFGKENKIKYHNGIVHLNSSQALCINFFKKFFEKEKWEKILIKTLKSLQVPILSEKIECAVFEYEPDAKERTNFDFYLILDNKAHISFEIKYTESEFGSISPDRNDPKKYKHKWTEIYSEMVLACPYITCNEQEFYKKNHYQINRNICYAREGDIVLFLTPRANNSAGIVEGRHYIDSFTKTNPRIMNIYWEDISETLMNLIVNEPELMEYYNKFKEKYIDIL